MHFFHAFSAIQNFKIGNTHIEITVHFRQVYLVVFFGSIIYPSPEVVYFNGATTGHSAA